jgi:D-glycero-alpha-D-manno-heptose 1-phosphate guanylyltransferase
MQAIVLAGGLGTRLRARVADVPKALAPVAGRPFLEFLLDWLDEARCQRVVLATGHLSGMIEERFGTKYRGLSLAYSREHTPLGTGGAVAQAMAELADEPTLVMNGDTWFGFELARFIAWCEDRPDSDAIALREVPDVSRYGSVQLDGDLVVEFGEKTHSGPGLINAGIYCLRRRTFAALDLPPQFSLETDFFRWHARALGLRGFVAEGPFIDIGIPMDYDRAQVDLPRWAARRWAPRD